MSSCWDFYPVPTLRGSVVPLEWGEVGFMSGKLAMETFREGRKFHYFLVVGWLFFAGWRRNLARKTRFLGVWYLTTCAVSLGAKTILYNISSVVTVVDNQDATTLLQWSSMQHTPGDKTSRKWQRWSSTRKNSWPVRKSQRRATMSSTNYKLHGIMWWTYTTGKQDFALDLTLTREENLQENEGKLCGVNGPGQKCGAGRNNTP
jgi:hypothetical protein